MTDTTNTPPLYTLWQHYGFLPEHGGPSWIKICTGTHEACEAERYRQGCKARVLSMEIHPVGSAPVGEEDYAASK